MTNKNVAKTVVATGAAVVIVTMGAPLLVAAPLCLAIGGYLGWKLSSDDDDEKRERDKNDE